jgi:indole-3-glycerol phosphate synthase/phosphoribosylanthranilate isomerase
MVTSLGLKAVQLHGQEDQAYVNQLKAELPSGVEIWKAYGVTDAKPELLVDNIDRHLLDAQVGTQTGGTGHVFDWSLIGDPSQIMLAGGLSPENARQAANLGCLGLDLNSGVESAPGKKDSQKLLAAFNAIRNY